MPDPTVNSLAEPTLTTRKLTLAYDKVSIVKDLSAAIPRGKITALVGPNGCGKSTLLRGLARLLKPQSGVVYLDGESIAKLPTRDVAKRLGVLPQAPVAPEGLTVRELVAQGRYPHQSWLQQWSQEDEALTDKALRMTDMQGLGDRPLDTLSGGQRQRAWIAMTLAQDTNILLLDEPTTFLDLAHQLEVLDLLYDLNQTRKHTIVMVLHDLNQASRYADYLLVMRQGTIFVQGTPVEVMTEAMVQEVFGLESRVVADPVVGTPMCIPVSQKIALKHR
jgi:iron complex transport system ATP-binding protein